mmetsp:Transcript_4169/g.12687  ORF Transcript_4169/g.12687 Transcript_4169/m.12687 type:complete len:679 (-) Transcript_4169:35-2071(-)
MQRDELVVQLAEITGMDVAKALALLQSTNWNLERAVTIHFEPSSADPPLVDLSDEDEDEDEEDVRLAEEDDLEENEDENDELDDDGAGSDPLCTPPRARIRRPLRRQSTGLTPPRAGVGVRALSSSLVSTSYSSSPAVSSSALARHLSQNNNNNNKSSFSATASATAAVAQSHNLMHQPNPKKTQLLPDRSATAASAPPPKSPEVRAPIPARMSVLADEVPLYVPTLPPRAPRHHQQQHGSTQLYSGRISAGAGAGAPAHVVHEAFRDFGYESELLSGQRRPQSTGTTPSGLDETATKLAEMYRPPFAILHRGDFTEARVKAASLDRWLIVNFQDPSVFDSQRLNRDTWSDVILQRIIKESCIFWQVYARSQDGVAFGQQYMVESAPHTMIIDPRTGASLLNWLGFVSPEHVREDLRNFLQTHRLGNQQTLHSPPKLSEFTLTDQTEDEQLAAAIAASIRASEEADNIDSAPGEAHKEDASTKHQYSGDEYVSADELPSSDFDNGTDSDEADEQPSRTAGVLSSKRSREPQEQYAQEQEDVLTPARARKLSRSSVDPPVDGVMDHSSTTTGKEVSETSQETSTDRATAHTGADDDDDDAVKPRGQSCQLQLRLPSGEVWLLELGGENTLQEVSLLVSERIRGPCTLSKAFPRKVVDDLSQTLEEADLTPKAVLYVQEQ